MRQPKLIECVFFIFSKIRFFLFVEFLLVGYPGEWQGSIQHENGHRCKMCGKTFANMGSLYKHNNVHKGKTRCPICKVLLSRIDHMKRHMVAKHGLL